MGVFAIGIEHALDITVQRLHDRDPRQHCRTAPAAYPQCLDRDLQVRQVGFLFREAGDVSAASRNVIELLPV